MEISGFLVVFLSQDSDPAKTSGLAECAKAVSKTNLWSRLLMLTCMKRAPGGWEWRGSITGGNSERFISVEINVFN